jgi:hypothetical protein
MELIKEVREEVPNIVMEGQYMDDASFLGEHQDLRKVVEVMGREGPKYGLHLNKQKTEIWWWPDKFSQEDRDLYDRDLQQNRSDGFKLLGCPLGSSEFCSKLFLSRVSKAEEIMAKIPTLEEPHAAYMLLRQCAGFPKISFALRTSPPPAIMGEPCERFDRSVATCLAESMGLNLPAQAQLQASLPIRLGGLGLQLTSTSARAAFVASNIQSQALQSALCVNLEKWLSDNEVDAVEPFVMNPAQSEVAVNLANGAVDNVTISSPFFPRPDFMSEWESIHSDWPQLKDADWSSKALDSWCPPTELAAKLRNSNHPQAFLTSILEEIRFQKFLRGLHLEGKEITRIKACSSHEASAFLHQMPMKALGLWFDKQQFSTLMKLRLGLNTYPAVGPCPACKTHQISALDRLNPHGMNCRKGDFNLASRHNKLRNEMAAVVRSTGCHVEIEKEVPKILMPDVTRSRPADIFVDSLGADRNVAVDFTIINPLAQPRSSNGYSNYANGNGLKAGFW